MMKRIAMVIAALMLGAGVAQAQDTPPIWNGLYVGAHAGYGWGDMNVDLSTSSGAIHYNDPFVKTDETLKGGSGALGGLQIGANRQVGNLVFGIEADVSWTGMDAKGTYTTPLGSQWDIKQSLDMFGTVRGRLGIATGPLMLYGTGGFAWGITDTTQATHFVDGKGNVLDEGGRTSGSNNHFGWVVGGGAEWAFASGWSLKAEYLYVDLGRENYALSGTTKPNGSTPYVETFGADMQFHIARAGLNYRF